MQSHVGVNAALLSKSTRRTWDSSNIGSQLDSVVLLGAIWVYACDFSSRCLAFSHKLKVGEHGDEEEGGLKEATVQHRAAWEAVHLVSV